MNGILYSNGAPTWLASIFIPGWGQLCQGRGRRAAWHFAQWIVCLTLAIGWSGYCWLAVTLVAIASTGEAYVRHQAEEARRQSLARTFVDPARASIRIA
jgi:TM2 domain-containing membrane protein YozV